MSECFISVDVETSGPLPGRYSLLTLGACVTSATDQRFYVEIKPITPEFVPEALQVSNLSLDELQRDGKEPERAMAEFAEWAKQVAGDAKPVFVGFNAAFDWAFVNWYFHHYSGDNPFNLAPVDIKSMVLGLRGGHWDDTRSSKLPSEFQPDHAATHNALDDALAQAEIFTKLLKVVRT